METGEQIKISGRASDDRATVAIHGALFLKATNDTRKALFCFVGTVQSIVRSFVPWIDRAALCCASPPGILSHTPCTTSLALLEHVRIDHCCLPALLHKQTNTHHRHHHATQISTFDVGSYSHSLCLSLMRTLSSSVSFSVARSSLSYEVAV